MDENKGTHRSIHAVEYGMNANYFLKLHPKNANIERQMHFMRYVDIFERNVQYNNTAEVMNKMIETGGKDRANLDKTDFV